MSEYKGLLVICDFPLCHNSCFLNTTGDGERDGGFTRWNKFEKYPEGWGWEDGKRLCPKHYKRYKDMIRRFYTPDAEPENDDSSSCNTLESNQVIVSFRKPRTEAENEPRGQARHIGKVVQDSEERGEAR